MSSSADQLARLLADVTRRLDALERAGQLSKSSVDVDGVTVPVASGIAAGLAAGTVATAAQEAAQEAYEAAHNIGPDQLADDAVVFGKIAVGAVGAQAIRADALIGQLIATAPDGARVELKPADATNTVYFYTGRVDEVYPGGITAYNATGGLALTAAGIGVEVPGETLPAARLDIGVDPSDATRRLVGFTWAHGFDVLADENILLQGAGSITDDGGHISIGKPRGTNTYARGVHVSGNITLDPNYGGGPGYGGTNAVHVLGDLDVDGTTHLVGDVNIDGPVHVVGDLEVDGALVDLTDTGWVDVTVKSGFAAQGAGGSERPQVRMRLGEVRFRGGFSSTGITASGNFNVGLVPEGFRPLITNFGRCGTASGAADAVAFIRPNGDVELRTNATLSAYYFPAVPPWLTD